MEVLSKIRQLLNKAGVEFEEIKHEPVYTSQEAAQIRDENISDGAKSLVLMGDGKPLLVVVPGDKKADFKKVKAHLHISDLRMATPEEVKQITGIEVGAIAPVGKAMGLDSYYDNSFMFKEMVAFNAGHHEISIIMKTDDLLKVENPELFDLTK